MENKIKVFENKQVRAVWNADAEEWYFSVVDVCWVLADSPDYLTARKYWNKLKQFVRRNNLWSQVEFLGHVDNLEKEYEKADLIVLPSIAEGTPNVVLEAYAYGRPVIVSDVGEERNLVKNPEEIDSCIKYVEGLSDNLYRELIERNRKIVIENYSIEKMCNSFYKVLSRW